MENQTLIEIMEKMLAGNKFSALKELLTEMNVVDIAQAMDAENQLRIFRLLPKDSSADVFSYLDSDVQSVIVDAITSSELKILIEDMFLDDAVDFLEEVPANVVTKVLAHATPETRNLINKFLQYPENSAGSIMTIEMSSFPDTYTVKQAISELRKTALDKETIYTCYCTDNRRKLVGSIPLRRLIVSSDDTLIKDIMDDDDQLICVNTLDDQEAVAAIARKYDLLSVPVVDNEKRLVGIITIDDIVDVIEEENTEDFEKMALLHPSEDEYLKTGVFKLTKNRIVWLLRTGCGDRKELFPIGGLPVLYRKVPKWRLGKSLSFSPCRGCGQLPAYAACRWHLPLRCIPVRRKILLHGFVQRGYIFRPAVPVG